MLHKTALGLAIVIALSSSLATSCNEDASEGVTPSWLALYTGEPNADDVGLDGKLLRDGPCLYVEGAGSRTLLLLPARETTWIEADGGTLRLGDQMFSLGESVRLSGSGIDDLDDFDWQQRPDASCDMEFMFLVGL